jgi:methionyl-tRNA synthetase
MKHAKKHLVTAALPYANGPLHIGHIAGAYLPADIYVRHLRNCGEEVLFICGSDEHGAAITLRAKKEGITPQEIVDKYHQINKKAFEEFGISFDIFDRTSAAHHHQTAQDFFKVLNDKGVFEKKASEQYYDEEHQQFLADRYVQGTCPKCGYEQAYGDQCERCGSSLSPLDLINPLSTLSGNPPVLRATEHWYLPMEKDSEWLEDWITKGNLRGEYHHDSDNWRKQVIGQCMSWINAGLEPRAMTRDLDWGVPVPLKNTAGKVLYVWLDAPIGYISATQEWCRNNGKNWKDYWQNTSCKLVHFIAKDNIVFHCIIFPILLEKHGNFNLPVNVAANEFLNLEGDKISTSREWAVWLHEYLLDFPHREDELRYVLTSIAPETKDSEFTWSDYQARVNNELVAILGNFVNRTLVLTHKYFEGRVPPHGVLTEVDQNLVSEMEEIPMKVDRLIRSHKYREAQFEWMKLARLGNKYLADTEPWKLIKSDKERVETILNLSVQLVVNIAIAGSAFLPRTCDKIFEMMNWNAEPFDSAGKPNHLKPGHIIHDHSLLFTKVDDEDILKQIEKLKKKPDGNKSIGKKEVFLPEISFDDFTRLDIRVGEVIEAEPIKGADKLLKLRVDIGSEVRTVASGIAQQYSPEEVIGKNVAILVNLAPRKIRGVKSEGMILMAEKAPNNLSFIEVKSNDFKGSRIK